MGKIEEFINGFKEKVNAFVDKLFHKTKKREPLTVSDIDTAEGLNVEQIQERRSKNYTNDFKAKTSKSVFRILFGNIFNFFNIICMLVFAWIITVSKDFEDVKNSTFMFTIFVNICIGIVQELKAKKTMDKLSLMTSADVRVVRGGRVEEVKYKDILIDDIVLLSAGEKICSDAVLLEGSIEVNESQLTGESLPVKKEAGDELFSGSFVVSGNGRARTTKIAEENYIQQITLKAKEFKETKSELLRNIRSIMRIIGLLIFPVAALAFFNNFNAQLTEINAINGSIFNDNGMFFEALKHWGDFSPAQIYSAYRLSVISTAGQLVGMLPTGMVLLVSVTLAAGVIRLSRKKALVHDLYAIEMLARVSTICLDKTGTLTDGTMKVVRVLQLGDRPEKRIKPLQQEVEVEISGEETAETAAPIEVEIEEQDEEPTITDIIFSMQLALGENNQTALALQNYFIEAKKINSEFSIPFSSERKVSAVYLKDVGLCVLGAPEYVTNRLSQKLQREIEKYQQNGNRCLLLAINDSKMYADRRNGIPAHATPCALIIIEDNIKKDVEKTIALFKQNDVSVRIISGDNPITVSAIAKRIGVKNAERYISLQNMTDTQVQSCALDYTVFGRVNPGQKKLLIQIFKNSGETVAMVGDGVNDILALKESDCSIAMANGSDAARDSAHIVLLNSDFACMPAILNEGRRAINNVERASSLFLTKTLFSFLFAVCLIFMQMSNPIEPVHLTFTSFFAIGIASFILAMEPNNSRVNEKFLPHIAKTVIPSAVSLTICLVTIMLLRKYGVLMNASISDSQYQTLITYSIFGSFIILLHRISKPLNALRGVLLAGLIVAGAICAIVMPILPNQSLNLFKLSTIGGLAAVTLLGTVLFASEKVSKTTETWLKIIDEKRAKNN